MHGLLATTTGRFVACSPPRVLARTRARAAPEPRAVGKNKPRANRARSVLSCSGVMASRAPPKHCQDDDASGEQQEPPDVASVAAEGAGGASLPRLDDGDVFHAHPRLRHVRLRKL